MKTLYSILGVGSEATTEQIERAYTNFRSKLQSGADGLSTEEISNQMVAIREAYSTLTNPILRQRYDQKISETNFQYADGGSGYAHAVESGRSFGFKTVLLVGVIVLAGIYLYNNNVKEREKLRIAHEHEVQMKAVQIAEDRQKQEAKVQDIILDKSTSNAEGQRLRMEQLQFERESAQQQQLDLQRQRMEMQQQQQRQQEEANRQRQEQQRKQQQLQSEKRLLQQMERDNYGKVITY